MEYLVLARKYRPQSFEGVAGQEHVVRTLTNAIGQGRVGHAFLFSGPRGVGKTSVARILAKSLNCEKGPTASPCNVCANCREITGGTSLDVREIDGASNRGIDEIRELRENVKFAPAAAKYKIYIIDEVHMLTREAFNALLKTLEEPPSHVIFIFATTENHKVPATILSRCQCYDFRRISLKEIAVNLGRVAAAEGIEVSPSALSWIAEAGDGSMRDAQSIFDQVISYTGLNINDDDVEDILGLTDRKYLFRLSEAVLTQNAGACLMILEEAYLAGIDMKHFYSMILKHFRNLLLVKIAASNSATFDIAPEQIEKLQNQVSDMSRETLQRYLEILLSEADSFRRSQEPRMKLETVLVRLAYLAPIVPLSDILSTLESLEQRLECSAPQLSSGDNIYNAPAEMQHFQDIAPQIHQAQNHPTAAPEEKRAEINISAGNPPSGNLQELGNQWKRFIKRENPPLGAKIDSAEILSYENDRLTLGFPKGYIFLENVTEKLQKDQLEKMTVGFFQKNITLAIQITETAKANGNGNNGRSKTNNLNDIKREAMNQPILQKVLAEFVGAEIVDIKPRIDKKQ